MEKSDYKEMLADSFSESSKLKNTIKTLKTMVYDTPNNMELGKKMRSFFLDEDSDVYIYESPDGGETIYRRRAGDYENREQL